MSTLHLLNYNNYYNRIVKREPSLSNYQAYQVKYKGQATDPNGNTAIIEGVNFVDGNFVDTTQVVNWQGDLPNYLLVVEDNIIKSRWFVVEADKTRSGQLLLTLHRDLVVDYYPNLLNDQTAIFVEKATIPSQNDLIFNSEDMTFNQIKTSEILLKDDTQCPWIVLYGARKKGEGQDTTFKSTFITEYPFIDITEQQYNDLYAQAERPNAPTNYRPIYKVNSTRIYLFEALNRQQEAKGVVLTNNTMSWQVQPAAREEGAELRPASVVRDFLNPIYKNIVEQVQNLAPSYRSDVKSDFYDEILRNQGRYLRYTPPGSSEAKYYRINVHTQGEQYISPLPSTYAGALETVLNPLRDAYTVPYQVIIGLEPPNNVLGNIIVEYNASYLRFTLDEVAAPATEGSGDTVEITANRYHLADAPYDMFCLPLSDNLFIDDSKIPLFKQLKSNLFLNLSVANQLIADYGAVGQIYDAQILPFCPISQHMIRVDDAGNLIYDINDENTKSFSYIRSSVDNDIIGYVLHANNASFSLQIPLSEPIVISDYKIESECDLYRLNSPNYAAVFEFNAAKNGGVTTFNIKCTYKPFSPYIKVYPNFGRLYGGDYNDARGLICSGDFSLPMLTDQWKTYELSNKNYQASFDRQIQNIEINNSVQREREIWGVAAGSVSGAIQGATGGALSAGGPAGAIVGGLIGAGASIAGGIRDIQLADKLRAETIDYAKDQFGYQLGNIKALPQTLSRTSAYNIDNKYFPFLEYYTCSDIEKQALRDKIKYNGMTVMAIGTMKYYKENYQGEDPMYFKGKLIRLDGFDGDFHILNAIANEIYKGVFI